MLKNTQLYGGIIYSQKVLLKLVEKGLTREEAYMIVQKHAHQALNNGDFMDGILSENILSSADFDECFNEKSYLNNIQEIFNRFY
jgi:adenylosuccinate lyase